MKIFPRTDNSYLGSWWWTLDHSLLGAIIVLILFGIAMVSSASPPVALHLGLNQFHFLQKHIIMLIPAIVMLLGISMLTPRYVWRLASITFVVSCVFIVFTLLFGMEIKGAQRWIHLFGFSLQPSEFLKPAFVVCAAWLIALQKEQKETKPHNKGFLIAIALYSLSLSLLLLQPDFGMSALITAVFIAQIFLAGLQLRWVLMLFCGGAGGACLAYLTLDHVRSRVNRFLDPSSGDTFQVDRSLEAFQNGGLFGTGPGQGSVKLSLPDAHADFIFSVVGEELGLFFVLILMGVFAFILLRGYNSLIDSDNMFTVLAVGGLLTMMGLQVLVHIGSSLQVLPAKGMTLPFISYGGSSLLSMGYSCGMVLALLRFCKRKSIARGGIGAKRAKGAI